ncbi:MAG TPA: DUF2171 domain-containing protein [Gaiellaceae bacterium]|jgi:hypothetical protein|nr:DUF2171 domain-containing protein [Gaiellaceae bacterium]
MADPVSWLVIEPGWAVVAADGTELGKVEEVVGDTGVDIFNGLSVSTGFLARPRYVPAEQVAEITQGRIRLALTRDQFERLSEFREPPASLEVSAADPSLTDRVADVFSEPDTGPHRVTPWRRLVERIFGRR